MRASDVGGRIRQIRQQMKLTQAQFAQRLGVTKVSVARYEAGRIPRMRVLEEIAKLGGVTMSSLLEAQDRPPRVGSPEDRFYKVAADSVPPAKGLPKALRGTSTRIAHADKTRAGGIPETT